MTRLLEYLRALRYHINGFALRLYLYATGCEVGRNVKCLGFPTFRDIPKGNISLGNNVVLGKGVIFEIARTGQLSLGNEVVIGDNVRLSSTAKITFEDWSGIAENSSIRGSFHRLAKSTPYMQQGNRSGDIHIGRDALIGANTMLLLGATIPEGAVVGALSLVTRHDILHPYGIFAGSPLKHIRDRQ